MHTCSILDQCHPITLNERDLVNSLFQKYPPQISEYTFTNLFAWAEVHHAVWCSMDDHLLLTHRANDGSLNILPPVGPDPARLIRELHFDCHGCRWKHITKDLVDQLPATMTITPDRESWDYVYRIDDLRSLKGKKYDGKRNFIKRFGLRDPITRPLVTGDRDACLHIQERWLDRQQNNPTAVRESTALMKTLQFWDVLAIHGVAIELEGQVVAFAIGEPLNSDTFVQHFEKALPDETGIYPYLLHAFAQTIPSSFSFLNREQDLGIEGIRKAKESWNPDHLVEKYLVTHPQICEKGF